MPNYFPPSELPINGDGSAFHLHIQPQQLADKVILVGDPARVETVAAHFDSREADITNREFHTVTGTYEGKRLTVLSTGIGCDNIDITVNEEPSPEPGPEPGPEPQPGPEPEPTPSKTVTAKVLATGNPIAMLLVVLMALVSTISIRRQK